MQETIDEDALPHTSPYRMSRTLCNITGYPSIFKLYISVFMHVTIDATVVDNYGSNKMPILCSPSEAHDIADKS